MAFDHCYIDGDVLRYMCGFAVEYTLYHVEGLSEPLRGKTKYNDFLKEDPTNLQIPVRIEDVVEPVSHAIQILKNMLSEIKGTVGCKCTIIISGDTNFRNDVATIKPYKGNRPDRKPQHFQALTDWMVSKGALISDGIEADDLLAIKAGEHEKDKAVIASIDKDLLQVPGVHYNFNKKEFIYVDDKQGWFNLCAQIMAGDSTDNIQGIPKIGIKTAEKLLEPCETTAEMCEVVQTQYELYYKEDWPFYLNENAELVYLLRYEGDKWEAWIEEDYEY